MQGTANSFNFLLKPSRQQTRLNLILVLAVNTAVFSSLPLLGFLLLQPIWLTALWLNQQPKGYRLSHHHGQWQLQRPNQPTQNLTWRNGCVRRKHLIIWQTGNWPWQRLHIRPDSLEQNQFRQLLTQLACTDFSHKTNNQ
ncbi:MAG: hypothetical protein WAO12_01105 [Venatoribacter sp.]